MYFRIGLENNVEGRSLPWILDHPGCFAYGQDGSEAIASAPAAIQEYADWIVSHGGSWLDPESIQLVVDETWDVYTIGADYEPAETGYEVNAWFRYARGPLGRKLGRDYSYYERLDASEVLKLPGPKVFCFHGAVTEMKPRVLAEMAGSMPASLLPKGFGYYAGGHVHERMTAEIPGWGLIVYPGPLFGDGYRDLESKQARGFYLVELPVGKAPSRDFRELPAKKTRLIEIDAQDRAPEDVNRELRRKAEEAKAEGAIVLVKVRCQRLLQTCGRPELNEFRTNPGTRRSQPAHLDGIQSPASIPFRRNASLRTCSQGIVLTLPASNSADRRWISSSHSSLRGGNASAGTVCERASINSRRSPTESRLAEVRIASKSDLVHTPFGNSASLDFARHPTSEKWMADD